MKFQDSSFNGFKVTVGTKSVTHAPTHARTKSNMPHQLFQSWGHNKNTCQNKDRLGYRSDKGNGNLGFVKTTVNKTVFIKEKRKEKKNFFLADFEKKLYRNIFQSTVYIHVDRTIPLLYNSEISSLEPSSVVL